ncbi:hypothetical protein LUZ60_012633 [Juncus effusus]|nr:hypothetical protein LUZ60_012633 [Juncus effusus]
MKKDSSDSSQGFEGNAMALLDSSGFRDTHELHDDRVAFLKAVRSIFLDSDSSKAPSWNIYNATFKILIESKSLELILTSYQILTELIKRYPRTYAVGSKDLFVDKEAWSPFILGIEAVNTEGLNSKNTDDLFDPAGFASLASDISHAVNSTDFELSIEPIENILVFQFLVEVLEADFIPRQNLYKDSSNWLLLRESMLNILLGSRKLQFKNLIKDCISIMLKKCRHEFRKENFDKSIHDSSLVFALFELEKRTFISLQKFLTLILEFDLMKKEADLQGTTTRTDGSRISALEIILDELTYNIDKLSPFLMAFSEPKWKLEIILQYFSKYCLKTSARSTRRSNGLPNEITVEYIFNNFSNSPNAKIIAKKLSSEITQILLAHLFQACLLVLQGNCTDDLIKKIGGTVFKISESFISAFQNLRENDNRLDIMPFEKEALFTAVIMADKSG